MLRPRGIDGPLVLVARGRDRLTDPTGGTAVVGEASLDATVDYMTTRHLTSLRTEPDQPLLQALIGTSVATGFRGAVDLAAPALEDSCSLLYLLLDDLPVATLVSGYALSHAGARHPRAGAGAARPDICAGWRAGGTIMRGIALEGTVPVVTGPTAPVLERPDDPWSWHDLDPLPARSMRRRRRLDLISGDTWQVDAMFRDSHVDDDGRETVVHEYAFSAVLDPDAAVIRSASADPRVLPWVECPDAAASAGRLAGRPLDDLRSWVRNELVGVPTCTHLNDLLRAVADVRHLAPFLAERSAG